MLLTVPAALAEDHLAAALQSLLDHHDALRLRLDVAPVREDAATLTDVAGPGPAASSTAYSWRLSVAPPGAVSAAVCLRRVDIAGLDAAARQTVIAEHAPAAAGRLAPANGLMLQAVWFDAGEDDAGRLLLTIHHLAVDGVSWRILLPDLKAACTAIAHGETSDAAGARQFVPALGA